MKALKLIIVVLLFSSSSNSQEKINFNLSTKEWKEDLKYLKETILKKHKKPYHFNSKNSIESTFNTALKKLDSVSAESASLVLASFAAKFGDGHTYVRPYREFKAFPFWVKWFDETLHITAIREDLKDYRGAEILKFNDVPTSQVLKTVSVLVPKGESKNLIKNDSEYFLRFSEVLYALKIIPTKDNLELTLKTVEGEIKKISFSLITEKTKIVTAQKDQPLLMYRSSLPMWYYQIKNTSVGYFNFTSYSSTKKVREFASELEKWLKENNIKTLIVDFRSNIGGDFNKGRLVLKKIKKTVLLDNIKVFVAISKSTFSAGMSNACDFKYGLNGRFIGEISGARPNGYQESNDFILPNSKLPCSYSSKYYTFSKMNTSGIIPEIPITYTWEEFYLGIDPLINWVLSNN